MHIEVVKNRNKNNRNENKLENPFFRVRIDLCLFSCMLYQALRVHQTGNRKLNPKWNIPDTVYIYIYVRVESIMSFVLQAL